MSQEVRNIPIDQLHMWTENPRDPVDASATDRDIILRAIDNESGNWELDKMLSEIGDEYYYNEIPTVVEINNRYIVYDGNRRLAVIKCLKNSELYSIATNRLPIFNAPLALASLDSLPCNVCDLETALTIVERTHASSGRWGKLQYEQFLHVHRNAPKGRLMALDEAGGGIVSRTPKLNGEYVQQRLLSESSLNPVGLSIKNGKLFSSLSEEESRHIIEDIARVMEEGLSKARKNPGDLKGALVELDHDRYINAISYNPESSHQVTPPTEAAAHDTGNANSRAKTRRLPVQAHRHEKIFGGSLRPKGNRSNEMYRAIEQVYAMYLRDTVKNSHLLPFIGFSMRLLLETIAQEYYAAQNPPSNHGDNAWKDFAKEVVKPLLRKAGDSKLLNDFSLDQSWVDGDMNLEAIVGKWAHGTMDAAEMNIINCSKIAGYVIRQVWSR